MNMTVVDVLLRLEVPPEDAGNTENDIARFVLNDIPSVLMDEGYLVEIIALEVRDDDKISRLDVKDSTENGRALADV